jgi:hypothetical protein
MREEEALVQMDVRVTKTWRQESRSRFLARLGWLVLFKRNYDPISTAYIELAASRLPSNMHTVEAQIWRHMICFLSRHL